MKLLFKKIRRFIIKEWFLLVMLGAIGIVIALFQIF